MIYPRIKNLREDQDITQQSVAQYLGISRSTYSGYENGIRGIPTEILIAIANFYNVSIDYLLGQTNNPKR